MSLDELLRHRFPAKVLPRLLGEYRGVIRAFSEDLPEAQEDQIVRSMKRASYHTEASVSHFKAGGTQADYMKLFSQTPDGDLRIILDAGGKEFRHGIFAATALCYFNKVSIEGILPVRDTVLSPIAFMCYEDMIFQGFEQWAHSILEDYQTAEPLILAEKNLDFKEENRFLSLEGARLQPHSSDITIAGLMAMHAHVCYRRCGHSQSGRDFLRHLHDGRAAREAWDAVKVNYSS